MQVEELVPRLESVGRSEDEEVDLEIVEVDIVEPDGLF
jgi:hypothetical protein